MNRRLLVPFALALPLLGMFAACDSEPETTATNTTEDASMDAIGRDASSSADATTNQDASTGDAATSDAPDAISQSDVDAGDASTEVTRFPVSANGHDRFHGVTYDALGNIYVVGVTTDSTDANADFVPFVAKMTATGTLDGTFGNGGVAKISGITTFGGGGTTMRGIVVQGNGKIVIAGGAPHLGNQSDGGPADARDRDIVVARLTTTGALDTTFGGANTGIAVLDLVDGAASGSSFVADNQWGLALASSDKLVVSGSVRRDGATDSDYAVVRLTADGIRDNTFSGDGLATLDISNTNASARSVIVLADDSVVLGGYFTDSSSAIRPVIWKLDANGIADPAFPVYTESVLAAQTEVYAVALQDAGFVTTGYGRDNTSTPVDIISLRIQADGGRDLSFAADAGVARVDVAGESDQSRALLVLPDARIVLVGSGRKNATDADALVVILKPDGTPDTSFGPSGRRSYDLGGTGDFFWGVALSPDKKHLAIAGIATGTGGAADDGALLVLPTGL